MVQEDVVADKEGYILARATRGCWHMQVPTMRWSLIGVELV